MYILDTDFIFSYFDRNQSTHQQAGDLAEKFAEQAVIISNLVRQELATVISCRFGYSLAKEVLENVDLFEPQEIFFDEIETAKIWQIFWSFQKKNISFIDCSNLFLAQNFNCKIASFDKFYPKEILLSLAA
jgi:predicted nucleic acid-binding protein